MGELKCRELRWHVKIVLVGCAKQFRSRPGSGILGFGWESLLWHFLAPFSSSLCLNLFFSKIRAIPYWITMRNKWKWVTLQVVKRPCEVASCGLLWCLGKGLHLRSQASLSILWNWGLGLRKGRTLSRRGSKIATGGSGEGRNLVEREAAYPGVHLRVIYTVWLFG